MKISSATYVLLVLIDDVNYGPQNLFSKKTSSFYSHYYPLPYYLSYANQWHGNLPSCTTVIDTIV